MSKPRNKPTAKVGKQYFARRYFISGYGQVEIGDLATPEALKLWTGTAKPITTNEQ